MAIIEWVIWVLNHIIPKSKYIVFSSRPDFDDQVISIYRNICTRNEGDKYKIIWLVHDSEFDKVACKIIQANRKNSDIIVDRLSLSGVWFYVRAKYVFYTHGLYGSRTAPKSQVITNIWHGMPVKAIELLEHGKGNGRKATYTVSTSQFYQEIMSRAMGVKIDSVLRVGNPRNDLMYSKPDDIKKKLAIKNGQTVFFHLPTYRESNAGPERVDGSLGADVLIYQDDTIRQKIETFLEEQDAILITKLHPMSTGSVPHYHSERVIILSDNDLTSMNLCLYEVLSISNCLITDISSVYIDYMATDSPIIFYFPDIDEYLESRKTVFNDIEDWLVGPLVKDVDKLFSVMKDVCDKKDDFKERRQKIKVKLNPFNTVGNVDRLLNSIRFS